MRTMSYERESPEIRIQASFFLPSKNHYPSSINVHLRSSAVKNLFLHRGNSANAQEYFLLSTINSQPLHQFVTRIGMST